MHSFLELSNILLCISTKTSLKYFHSRGKCQRSVSGQGSLIGGLWGKPGQMYHLKTPWVVLVTDLRITTLAYV